MSSDEHVKSTLRKTPVSQNGRTVNYNSQKDPHRKIKWGIWTFFLLLVFEGGLRKWVLPGLATPLLVVRDPIVIWILILAYRQGVIVMNKYVLGMVFIGVISFFAAVLSGHGNFYVAIFGARILLFHFPLIFVIGRVFTWQDVIKMGQFSLWLTLPMAILIAIQFYSPQSAFVNRGVGGDEAGAGFTGALDYFRPPGTFSFTNGTSLFFGFVTCFIIYFWLNRKLMNQIVLIAATAGLLAAIPLSISRGLLFQVVLTVLFAVLATFRKPEYIGRMLLAIMGAVVVFVALSNTSFFQTATGAFSNRFETANEVEGGLEGTLLDRYLGGLVGAINSSSTQPFFGYGIGIGTNVGSMLLGGEVTFLIAEGEWGRLIGETGPLLGLGIIFIRLGISWKIAVNSYKQLAKNNLLPWMLLPFCLTNLPQGQWAQPTSLGFSVLIAGLIIASFNVKSRKQALKALLIVKVPK